MANQPPPVLKVSPSDSCGDHGNARFGHPVFFRELWCVTRKVITPNRQYFRVCKLGAPMRLTLAWWNSLFGIRILHVLKVCPQKEMSWIPAGWNIALMTHLFSSWNFPFMVHPRKPVYAHGFSVHNNTAIASLVRFSAGPNPTRSWEWPRNLFGFLKKPPLDAGFGKGEPHSTETAIRTPFRCVSEFHSC